ncbi:MAG: glutamine--fructose-6-phosphate aminotransferase [Candidatus Magasanikbacteria bacterium RIFOXYD2_FULL_41_14]|uniref:Glutamine--fructose-6-phosphate aminotransferase [isomerizing] n=1 Tax=Candidatus Magasanikbacteria bacterium RIFOXYD2_FULL_41_14 TaxID=1798709 RepID=A0A1F6PC27_9BACT|nr:MAG: glutamine--fructose-6-phosphate aminotransferase [Candidatus Magasanikbacteria bacterium RIFOXYD2_FULL_41_14]
MCGIIGYIGKKQALPILVNGLRRLEYRGYDSAGVAISDGKKVARVRAMGKIDELANKLKPMTISGTVGIAHTRWATHGGVSEDNAHPHAACTDDLVIVHNGIIENYRELKDKFLKGHELKSQTDTEILAHLIEIFYKGNLTEAVRAALKEVRGTYGLVAMHSAEPDKLVAARLGSPLVIGVGDDEYFLASDTSPMLAHTKEVVFLDDGEIAEITPAGFKISNLNSKSVDKVSSKIDWDEASAQKQGFPHFMLKEIFDQPAVFMDAIRGRYNLAEGTAHLGGLNMTIEQMHKIRRVILLACGTASYASLVGKYAMERLAGIPTEVDVASEFRYRDPIIDHHTLVFGISQSGETADTLAALREAKRKGAYVRGIVNVIGSTMARETDGGTYMHAGPELAVASTKAYTNMLAVLILYAIQFGRLNRLTEATGERLIAALLEIPEKMKEVLALNDGIKKIAMKYKDSAGMLFLGRGVNYPVALEGSHKLKEISYIHSEAYPAGEMKHGANALLGPNFPVLAIITKNQLYEKMRSNVEEVKARYSPLILVATVGDESVSELADDIIYVPPTMELLEPLLNTIALQLFAYHSAVALGRDVDRPRNLAKSVTVE